MAEVERATGAVRRPVAAMILAGFAVIAAFSPEVSSVMEFSRSGVAAGEHWRWLTGHWAHFSFDHLFWDVAVFAMLGWLCERESRARFGVCVAVSAALIPVAVWVAHPELATYRGLSGIDSALFGLVVVSVLRRAIAERRTLTIWAAGLLGVGFSGKVLFEWVAGATWFVDSASASMVPVPLAHVVGAFVGVLCGLGCRRERVLTRGDCEWSGAK